VAAGAGAAAPGGAPASVRIDGSCHCGDLRWEAEVDPARVYFCHCTDCQAISGGSGRWAVPVPAARFRLLAGEPALYVKRLEGGRENHQRFCARCASPIYSSSPDAGHSVLRLRLGTARQRALLPPVIEKWTASAQPWARLGCAEET
jgi:hypothetical protein